MCMEMGRARNLVLPSVSPLICCYHGHNGETHLTSLFKILVISSPFLVRSLLNKLALYKADAQQQ